MKCNLSLLADDTNLGAMCDTSRGSVVPFNGILTSWTSGSTNLMMFNKDTYFSTCNGLILYTTSTCKCRRAILLLSSPTWMRIKKRLFPEVHMKKIGGNRNNLQQEQFLLDIKKFFFHYESELKLEMEQEQVAQKGCGTSILGDVQNLTDKVLTIVSVFWS